MEKSSRKHRCREVRAVARPCVWNYSHSEPQQWVTCATHSHSKSRKEKKNTSVTSPKKKNLRINSPAVVLKISPWRNPTMCKRAFSSVTVYDSAREQILDFSHYPSPVFTYLPPQRSHVSSSCLLCSDLQLTNNSQHTFHVVLILPRRFKSWPVIIKYSVARRRKTSDPMLCLALLSLSLCSISGLLSASVFWGSLPAERRAIWARFPFLEFPGQAPESWSGALKKQSQ